MIPSYVREIKAVFISELPTAVGDIQQVYKSIGRVYVYERNGFMSWRQRESKGRDLVNYGGKDQPIKIISVTVKGMKSPSFMKQRDRCFIVPL